MSQQTYVLDSDVLIAAKNQYYAFDICPGFWTSLREKNQEKRLLSIDLVRKELLRGEKTEELVQWVKRRDSEKFFVPVVDEHVMRYYERILEYVRSEKQWHEENVAKFAEGADGWLVAYGLYINAVVVTNEVSAPHSKKEIKIPDVCQKFGVRWVNTFEMLRELGIRFDTTKSANLS